jgi:hypothetical protein
VSRALPEHLPAIAENMREADRREVWASHRHTPQEALEYALGLSPLAWTCQVDGKPAFIWGAAREEFVISQTGAPWLLATESILKVRREFLLYCPYYVQWMHRRFARLENIVHADNHLSIRWLKWCGFTVEEDAPETRNGEKFYLFWRERDV